MKDEKKQIKSRQRVEDHGEVFTNEREVTAMCDLVAHECERLDSRFLEPACGDGNFLAEVLKRKLDICKKLYKKNTYDFERFSVLAVSSIYGVDVMQDNVDDCRARLFEIWNKEYESVCKRDCNNDTRDAVIYILGKNILCGNALTMMCVDEQQMDTETPILFPEWSLIGNKIKRRDFRLDVLIKANEASSEGQLSITKIPEEIRPYLSVNPTTGEYMAEPTKEYFPIYYRKVQKNG